MTELTKKDDFAEIYHNSTIVAVVYYNSNGKVSIVTNRDEDITVTVGGEDVTE